MLVSGLEFTKCLSEQLTGKTLIRLQSDLGLHWLSRPFWQASSVRNIRIFMLMLLLNKSYLGMRMLIEERIVFHGEEFFLYL